MPRNQCGKQFWVIELLHKNGNWGPTSMGSLYLASARYQLKRLMHRNSDQYPNKYRIASYAPTYAYVEVMMPHGKRTKEW